MNQPSEQQESDWIDSFVSVKPPSYIVDYHEGEKLERKLAEWRNGRRKEAIELLKEFLALVPHETTVTQIIDALDKHSNSDTIALAIALSPSFGSHDPDLTEAVKLANALLDPISRASLLSQICHKSHGERYNQAMRMNELKQQSSTGKGILSAALVIVVLFILTKFKGYYFELSPDSPQPVVVNSSWWGLSTIRVPVKWMTFESSGGEYGAWCAKSKSGEWYPYVYYSDGPEYDRPEYNY